jgi:chitinase
MPANITINYDSTQYAKSSASGVITFAPITSNYLLASYITTFGAEKIPGFSLSSIPFNELNYATYSDVYPTSSTNATLIIDSASTADVSSIVSLAHAAGCKVLVSLADNTFSPALDSILGSPTLLPAITENVANLVSQYGFDGVSLDWEQTTWKADHQTKVANLFSGLRATLPAGKILVLYSYQTARTDCVSAVNPDYVFLGYGPNISAQQAQLKYWVSQGFPASKIAVIIPEYGQDANGNVIASWSDIVKVSSLNAMSQNSASVNTIVSSIVPSPAVVAGGVLSWAGPTYVQSLVTWLKANGFAGAGLYEASYDVQNSSNSLTSITSGYIK